MPLPFACSEGLFKVEGSIYLYSSSFWVINFSLVSFLILRRCWDAPANPSPSFLLLLLGVGVDDDINRQLSNYLSCKMRINLKLSEFKGNNFIDNSSYHYPVRPKGLYQSQLSQQASFFLNLATFQCSFLQYNYQMSSFAYRASYKMTTSSNQPIKNLFKQTSSKQNRKTPVFDANRNNHVLGNSLTRIELAVESLIDQIEIYEWRSNTDYPIVNCHWKRVIFNQAPSFIANNISKAKVISQVPYRHPSQITSLWVENETIIPLEQFQVLSITQFLYAFKEALVGFERLFALFGSFEIIPGMIGVNLQGRVKVWVSKQYHTNAKLDIDQMSFLGKEQQYTVNKIKGLLMKNTCDSSTYREFFKLLENKSTFIECLRHIEDFSISKKIILGRKIIKRHVQVQKRPLSPIINLKPIARTPKFIAYMQHIKYHHQDSIPSLQFNQAIEASKNCHFTELKTKETSNQGDLYELTDDSLIKAGKIIKNKGKNFLLTQVRSLENLHEARTQPKANPNNDKSSIFQQMKRLLEDDPETESEDKCLNQLGRQVRESITIL